MQTSIGNDFTDWCESFAYVEDKLTHRAVPFKLYLCQKRVAELLVKRRWLWVLKARRLGLTWLLAAYATWLFTKHERRMIVILNQNKEYAQDFLDRMRLIIDNLPAEMKPKLLTDNCKKMIAENGSEVRSLACTKRAIRSLSADLVIFDEAAYMDLLKDVRKAAQPAVETGRGQVVAISTSNGPKGEFYEVWNQASANQSKYQPVFLDWRELKSRDDNWYEQEARDNAADPLYMKREYPSSAEEAFESAEGRVYPLFIRSEKFIHVRTVHKDWKKFRAIDFGGVDPFVCLWGAVIPGDGPGLTVDPSCANLIRELLAYSYDLSGAPEDKHNHACDALRYMIISPPITGHLHIYRELYIRNSVSLGYSLNELADRIDLLSNNETFKATYADKSRPDSIKQLCKRHIQTLPYKELGSNQAGEIIQGIVRVNELVVGTAKGKPLELPSDWTFTGLPEGIRKRGIY